MKFDIKIAAVLVILVIVIVSSAFVLTQPLGHEVTDQDRAVFNCVFLCKSELNKGRNLNAGPCLSTDNPAWDVSDWVCDVAHLPRMEKDNLPENQCPEYRVSAKHFVEVDPDCDFIRAA